MEVDKVVLSWLVTVPSGDINFWTNLKRANIETIEEALKAENLGKTKTLILERRLRKLKK